MSSTYSITTNLKSSEVACPCCEQVAYDKHFVTILQVLRDIVAVPFIYKDGGFFRCSFYNESIGGATDSYHKLGLACDISSHNFNFHTKWTLIHEAMKLGLTVGHYSRHIHLDKRPGKPGIYYGVYK